MNQNLSIKVIVGSTREGRFGDQPATWIANEAQKHENVAVEILDLRDFKLPFFDQPETPSSKKAPYQNPEVARWTDKIGEADAYIIVTPEYNRGPSAVLKNALDWVYPEWNRKAVMFVSYGTLGGSRAVEQLRQSAIELQMVPVRDAVHFVGNEFFPVKFGGESADNMFLKHTEKANQIIDELLWYGWTLKNARNTQSN